MQEDNTNYSAPTHSNRREVVSIITVIVTGLVVAVLVGMFVFRSYVVDGPSMEQTLHNGDRLIIWKLPHTIGRITGHTYIPNRGDIIVFAEPGLYNDDGSTKQLIKRVIALPGETVTVKDGSVTVTNKEHPNGFNPDTTLAYGKNKDLSFSSVEQETFTVEAGEVFAMGDNRNNSLDSRVFGPVEAKDIVGKLTIRLYPLGNTSVF